jgi:hypothetical protein
MLSDHCVIVFPHGEQVWQQCLKHTISPANTRNTTTPIVSLPVKHEHRALLASVRLVSKFDEVRPMNQKHRPYEILMIRIKTIPAAGQ